jgi:hypothetical protein
MLKGWWSEHETGFIAVGLFAGAVYSRFFTKTFFESLAALFTGLILGLLLVLLSGRLTTEYFSD